MAMADFFPWISSCGDSEGTSGLGEDRFFLRLLQNRNARPNPTKTTTTLPVAVPTIPPVDNPGPGVGSALETVELELELPLLVVNVGNVLGLRDSTTVVTKV